jgi:glutathione reductase (NADPH)
VQKSREIGIDLQVQSALKGIDKSSDGELVVHVSAADEKISTTLETDMVVYGAGRVPNIEGLDLMAAGVEHNIRGVKVNEYLECFKSCCICSRRCCSKWGFTVNSCSKL